MFSRKAPEEMLEAIGQMFMNPKFVEITKDQVNKLEFTCNLGNDFATILKLHEESGFSLLHAACKLLSIELEASFHPDLPTSLQNPLQNPLQHPLQHQRTALTTLESRLVRLVSVCLSLDQFLPP